MKEYFSRQIQLWGEDTQNSLQNKKIAIIGAGGLGSSIALALGCSGIGEIHIVDFDDVSIHNIHRQISFKLSDEGKNKAKINAQLIKSKSNFVNIYPYESNFETWSKKNIDVDIMIDATDNLQTRADIDAYAKEKNIPWIYGKN